MLKSFIISFGFEATGISPINVNKPLQSQYAINNVPHDTDNICQNYWMNSEENLSNLFYKEYGREITEADFNINIKDIFNDLKTLSIEERIPLSGLPPLFIENDDTIQRIEFD